MPAGADQQANRDEILIQITRARQDAIEAYQQIRTASHGYRLVVGRDFQPRSVPEVQAWLADQNALLLEYFIGQNASYLFVVPPSGEPRAVELTISQELAEQHQLAAGPLTRSSLSALVGRGQEGLWESLASPEASTKLTSRLNLLWQLLIPERERPALLSDQVPRLIVVPDGPLGLIPIETWVVEPGETPKYFLDVGPVVTYAPSATALLGLAQLPTRPTPKDLKPVLTIADAVYSAVSAQPSSRPADGLSDQAGYQRAGGRLTPLPFTGVESKWLSDVFQKQSVAVGQLIQKNATEAALRYNVPGRRVVHIACHGLMDAASGNLFGALALTPGKTSSLDDGFLTLAEIYELDLQGCELAILSACQTNFGPQQTSEGTWSLSRGFLVAGSRRVVASNWLVDDEAAASLMSYFAGGLATSWNESDLSCAKRLHAAKRWCRQQSKWTHPYYWGTFVLVGPN